MSGAAPARLFHVTTRAAWATAAGAAAYHPASLDAEGFVHLSTEEQLPGTLRRFFAGATDLAFLVIDPARLAAPVRWEDTTGHGAFPHLYGPLNLDAVVEVRAVPDGPDGPDGPDASSPGGDAADSPPDTSKQL